MSTRQLRINSPEQIRKKISDLPGKKINIVLQDRTVIFGTVKRCNENMVEIENMRLASKEIPLKDVTEIYYDTKE